MSGGVKTKLLEKQSEAKHHSRQNIYPVFEKLWNDRVSVIKKSLRVNEPDNDTDPQHDHNGY
jgi:hypothetical protein